MSKRSRSRKQQPRPATEPAPATSQDAPKPASVRLLVTNPGRHTPLFPVCESGRWGFINRAGEVVIRPQFAYAHPFSEGLARVTLEGRSQGEQEGFIDTKGDVVIHPGPPRGVMRACTRTEDWAWSFGDFFEGLASLWVNDATGFGGYINTKGDVLVQPRFKSVGDFGEGLALIELPDPHDPDGFSGKESGFVDPSGKVVIHPQPVVSGGRLRENRCEISMDLYDEAADKEDSRSGYLDRTGKIVVPATYICAHGFAHGLACVRRPLEEGGAFGFIDPDGNTVVPFDLSQCSREFGSDGVIYGVRIGEPVVLDSRGKVVAPIDIAPSAYVGTFVDGLASVSVEVDGSERCGFLDSKGKLALPLVYDRAEDFRDGLALVRTGNLQGYVDRQGTFVWKTRDWNDR